MNNLNKLRKDNNVKVKDIVEFIGCTEQYYYGLEKGDRRLNEDLLMRLADFYKCSIDYILGRIDKDTTTTELTDRERQFLEESKDYDRAVKIVADDIGMSEEVLEEQLAIIRKMAANKQDAVKVVARDVGMSEDILVEQLKILKKMNEKMNEKKS